jgi:hypothetical protein
MMPSWQRNRYRLSDWPRRIDDDYPLIEHPGPQPSRIVACYLRAEVAYSPGERHGRAGTSLATLRIKLATILLKLDCGDLQRSARPKPRRQPLQERGV